MLGRAFLAEEDTIGARPVVMISERLWERLFQGSATALGESLTLDGAPCTIISVVPSTFAYPFGELDIWITRLAAPALYSVQQVNDGAAYLNPTARLKPGVTLRQAQEEIDRLVAAYRKDFPEHIDAVTECELLRFPEEVVGQQRQASYLLLGAVACVHLIACFNVANLLLARFSSRSRENAVRLALGAAPARLVSAFLLESLALASAAALLGTVFAVALLRIFGSALATHFPQGDIAIDGGALGFMVLLTLGTALAVGWFPARLAMRRDLLEALKETAHNATSGRRAGTFRRMLLVAEIAFSLMLLIAVGLVATSFVRLLRVDPGFRSAGVFLTEVELPRTRYATAPQQFAVTRQIVERLQKLPGVTRVAVTDSPPLLGTPVLSPYTAADRPLPPVNQRLIAFRNIVTPGLFATLGTPLLEGRDFAESDGADAPVVAILNASMARQLFEGQSPLGRDVVLGITTRTAKVIGVVGDMRSENILNGPRPEIYFSFAQRPRPAFTLALRSDDEAGALAPSVRALLREIDPDIPLVNPRGLEATFRNSLSGQALAVGLLGLFSGTALVLALGGVYSVMSYSVLQRRGEIGVRLLLGASPADVRGVIVREGAQLAIAGLVLGLAGALFFSELLRRVLFSVPPVHGPIYLGAAVALGLVALFTCWLAARQTTAVDPLEILRTD